MLKRFSSMNLTDVAAWIAAVATFAALAAAGLVTGWLERSGTDPREASPDLRHGA